MKKRYIGLILLLAVAIIALVYQNFLGQRPDDLRITGLLGGEKIGLFESEDFQDYIKDQYGLTMDYRKSGSINMVTGDIEGQDYLFPASQLAAEIYNSNGRPSVRDDIIFNTPIVLYTRSMVVEALVNEGIVEERNGTYYVKMDRLANMIEQETKWADIGLGQLYGNILVDTTDPNKSNSGNMFLGLLANALNNNQVVQKSDLAQIKPKIQKIYSLIGYMQGSSADMFTQFLTQGVGAYPIIAGYENQLIEFSITDADTFQRVKDDIVILYPEPTVWSSHVYIALNENGDRGLEALKDPRVQEMAWEYHGFRTVVAGAEKKDFDVNGLADQITQVMPMPSYDVMEELMDAIK